MHAPLGWTPAIGQLIDLALEEDLGRGDITTQVAGSEEDAIGTIVARQRLVCCGLPVADWVAERAEPELSHEGHAEDGDWLEAGAVLARFAGRASSILRVERVVLNFLMRMCGVATITALYVDAVAGTRARIVDTRKTLPGWRALDKYAVRVGGGHNHRFDLGSGVLIKDNHIVACGSVGAAVRRAREQAPHPMRIEVEVESLPALEEALGAGADVLLLDNMTPEQVGDAARLCDGRAMIEVSGGIALDNVAEYAEALEAALPESAAAPLISIGALTHSVLGADISLDLSRASVQVA
ncbi:MAG: carboxylating nicotinate-nucleotide diphosphorylase [Myxococcales bacterium]|nr:carboxylating nicotinate-nucleotide diphosphorylase [Myxococcales bacterium]